MRWSHMLVLPALVAVLDGCAANPGAQASGRQANLITADDIQREAGARNAFELIRALRPNWLEARGVQSLGSPGVYQTTRGPGGDVRRERGGPTNSAREVMVYVDGTRMGGPEMLRQILASNLQEVRYLGGTEATSRFGTDHAAGAILVTLRR